MNESSHPRGWSEDVPGAAGEHVLDGHRTREVSESSQPRGWSEDVPEAAGERVLDEHRMVFLTQELGVHGGQVEVHLAGVLGLELAGLELDDDGAAEPEVEEQQVDVEVLATDFEVHPASHEREADAELEEKVADVLEQAALEVPLPARRGPT